MDRAENLSLQIYLHWRPIGDIVLVGYLAGQLLPKTEISVLDVLTLKGALKDKVSFFHREAVQCFTTINLLTFTGYIRAVGIQNPYVKSAMRRTGCYVKYSCR